MWESGGVPASFRHREERSEAAIHGLLRYARNDEGESYLSTPFTFPQVRAAV